MQRTIPGRNSPSSFIRSSVLARHLSLAAHFPYVESESVSVANTLRKIIIQNGRCSNAFLGSLLVQMYIRCGALDDAYLWFGDMAERNIYAWNFMVAACARNALGRTAFELLDLMMCEGTFPDHITFVHALSTCTTPKTLMEGKRMHAIIRHRNLDSDVITGTALISMYGRCGSISDASNLFHMMQQRNVITWNALLATYSHHGLGSEGLRHFKQMQQESAVPNKVTYVSMLDACGEAMENEHILAMVASSGFQKDVTLATASMNSYSKRGRLRDVCHVFCGISERNIISWNALMVAFCQNSHSIDVRCLLDRMQLEGFTPDDLSFLCVLSACILDGSLTDGSKLHGMIVLTGFESNRAVATAVLNMYGKCGSLESAVWTFHRIRERDVISWSAIIASYAQHGYGEEALRSFSEMLADGAEPDQATYLNLLIACSHAGLINEGLCLWAFMMQEQRLKPIAEHHECMVDLLGRAGQLDEAQLIAEEFCLQDRIVPWMALLGTCKNVLDLERAQHAAQRIFDLDPGNVSAYISLSNICGEICCF